MRFTIRKKLIGGFLSVLLLLGSIVGIANYELNEMDKIYSQLLDEDARQVTMIQSYKAEVFKQSNAVNAFLLTKDSASLTNYQIEFSKFTKAYQELEEAEKDPKGKELLSKMKLAQNEFLQIVNKEMELKKQNNPEYITLATTTAKEIGERFQFAAEDVVKYKVEQMQSHHKAVKKQMNEVKMTILIISGIALLVGMGIAMLVSFVISRPVNTVSSTLRQLSQGNLTVPDVKVRNKDEIGILASSMNELLHNLRDVIGKVYDSSVQVASSSEQLLASNEQSSHAAEQIAQSVQQTAAGSEKQLVHFEEVSSAVQEMATGIQQIAQSSECMKDSAEQAIQLTSSGNTSVESVVSKMIDISSSFEQTSSIVSSLGNRSKEINSIASLITEIANQTNLLALNAAIEAARAGEHGKGFAVVADEVRKLAEQTKNSADEISAMIHVVQNETSQAIDAVQSGNQLVEEGLAATRQANDGFTLISGSIDEVSAKVREVSSLVEELTAQSQMIVQTIGEVKEIAEQGVFATQNSTAATQEQVATMEEVTASAHGLTKLAEELSGIVSQFKF